MPRSMERPAGAAPFTLRGPCCCALLNGVQTGRPHRVEYLLRMKSAYLAPRLGREPVTGASSVSHHGPRRLLPRDVRE